jgi:hypothetical protein
MTECTNSPYKDCLNIPGSYRDMSYNYGADSFISRFDIMNLPDPELVGIEEKTKFSRKMSVYPNPPKNKLSISFLNDKVAGIANVRVLDVAGRTLINKEIKFQTYPPDQPRIVSVALIY